VCVRLCSVCVGLFWVYVGLFWVCVGLFWVYVGLFWVCVGLCGVCVGLFWVLSVCRALLSVCRALLSVYWALLNVHTQWDSLKRGTCCWTCRAQTCRARNLKYSDFDSFSVSFWIDFPFFGRYGVGWLRLVGSFKIIGLFCKRALQKRRYSAKETYQFEEPTNRSHPIVSSVGLTLTVSAKRVSGFDFFVTLVFWSFIFLGR